MTEATTIDTPAKVEEYAAEIAQLKDNLARNEAWAAEREGSLQTTITQLERALHKISQSAHDALKPEELGPEVYRLKDIATRALNRPEKVFCGSKLTLKQEFNLPDDEELLQTAIHAPSTKRALRQYDQWLRAVVKYGVDREKGWPTEKDFKDCGEVPVPFNSLVSESIFQYCRDRLWEELRDEDVPELY